jgi:hypothetical protein
VGLTDAAFKLNEFAQSVGQFGGGTGSFGYAQYLGLSAMNGVVGNYVSTQALYAQSQVTNFQFGMDVTVSSPAVAKRETTDEFGTGIGAGEGHNSNLANSPEVVLALNNILKDSPDSTAVEDVQKKLKDEYGIESKIEDIDGRRRSSSPTAIPSSTRAATACWARPTTSLVARSMPSRRSTA